MSELILQNQMDQKKYNTPSSFYKNFKLTSQGTNVTSIGTSTQQLLFEIPADNIVNLSRCSLSFYRLTVTNNVGVDTNATNTYCIPTNYFPFIQRLELYTSNNIRLVDVQNVDIYNKLSAPCNFNFLQNTSENGLLFPSRRLVTGASLVGDGYINSYSLSSTIIGYGNIDYGTAQGNYSVNVNFGANRRINVRLGDILCDSIFNVDQDIYFGKTLYLRITLNPIDKILMDVGANDFSTFASVTNKLLKVSNFSLNILVQANPMISQLVKENNTKGQTLIIPEIYSNSYQMIGGGQKSSILKVLSNAPKCKLYKLYSCLISSNNGAYLNINNTSNWDSSEGDVDVQTVLGKYNYIYMYLNSNNILNLDVNLDDDLNLILQQYGSHSFTDYISFRDTGVFAYVFDSQKIEKGEGQYDGNTLKGIDFPSSNEHSLQVQYNCISTNNNISNNANYTNHMYAVVLKEIYLKNGDLSLVPYM